MCYTYSYEPRWDQCVEAYFELKIRQKNGRSRTDLILPDGTNGLLYITEGTIMREGQFHSQQLLPGRLYLFGQKTHAVRYTYQAPEVHAFGFKLAPTALATLFGMMASDYLDQVVETPELNRVLQISLNQNATTSPKQLMYSIMEHFIERSQRPSMHVRKIIDFIIDETDCCHVNELARHFGMTYKSLARQFKKYVGMTPKLFIRIVRFNQCLRIYQQNPGITLTDLAYRGGFFDQMHFIKDARSLTGMNPGYLFNQESSRIEEEQMKFITNR